jgi:hypothetical protein
MVSKPLGRQAQIQFSTTQSPATVVRDCLRQYTLNAVFSRDLCAAQADGLLTLTGLEHPLELAGGALDASTAQELAGKVWQAVAQARKRFGRFLVLDSPEYWLAGVSADKLANIWDDLGEALAASELEGIVNLNCGQAPAWVDARITGPLFADKPPARGVPAECLDGLLAWLSAARSVPHLRLHWHLGEADFASATATPRLSRLLQAAPLWPTVAFTFDRPRQPAIALAEGVDRRHPAVLIAVGLHLPRLLDQPGVGRDGDKFLAKVPSLARMAVSAAMQKRNFLRRMPELAHLRSEFLVERARLVATPIGLDGTLRLLTGEGPESKTFIDLGRQTLASLRESLHKAGAVSNLDTAIADPYDLAGASRENLPPKNQLKTAAALQSAAGGGTVAVFLPEGFSPTAHDLFELLQFAWQRTDCTRLRFCRVTPQQHELGLQNA